MESELTFSSDPNALINMMCEICAKLCSDTLNLQDNVLFGMVMENVWNEDGSINIPPDSDPRAVKKLTDILDAVLRSYDPFIRRQKLQQQMLKDMTAQYERLNDISDRYRDDIFDDGDFRELQKMLKTDSAYMEKLDLFFANEKQKTGAESELTQLIGEISSFLEEYPQSGDEFDEEIFLDISASFCPVCGGSGIKSFCGVCGGNGVNPDSGECTGCRGAGWVNCSECGGTGAL